jgi:Tfp pilus assembly protein PilF
MQLGRDLAGTGALPDYRPAFCLFVLLVLAEAGALWASSQGGGFTVLGSVSLPNGDPAPRVIVKISSLAGYNREVLSDDQGRYQFLAIPGGRYRLTITNPQDTTHFIEPTEADTSRSSGNRLIVHLYLRTPLAAAKRPSVRGVVSVAEASQQIPKDAKKAFEDGLKRKADRQLDKALESFTKAIDSYSNYFQALAERGELLIARSQIAEAIVDFERALKLNEDCAPALRGLGYCYLEQQKFPEATQYLERAASVEPAVANTHLFLGIASLALNRRDVARQALQEALKIDGKGAVTAHIYMADLLAREKRYEEAADELRIYLDAKPDAPNAARLKAKEAELRTRAKSP